MFARRTIAHPFEHHLADGEALAAQLVQSHTTHGEIAAVLVDAQLNAVLGTQHASSVSASISVTSRAPGSVGRCE